MNGSTLNGTVGANAVNLQVTATSIDGYVGSSSVQIAKQDHGLGGSLGSQTVNLSESHDRIEGWVGQNSVDITEHDDGLVGSVAGSLIEINADDMDPMDYLIAVMPTH